MPKHTLDQKISALNEVKQGADYESISEKYGVSVVTLKKWQKQQDELRRDYRQKLRADAADTMAIAQQQMADKTLALIKAIDMERITKAPLNQVATTLGILIDRFLKLHDIETESNTAEQAIRIEYYDASTGKISAAPPWARNHPESSGAVQGGSVREALRQDDDSPDYRNGKSVSWDAGLVDGTDLSNGEPGMARFEDDDNERDWYHD